MEEEFIIPERPVILRGAARGWPAVARWTADFLKGAAPGAVLPVVEAEGHHHPDLRSFSSRRVQLPFPDYVDRIASGDASASRWLVLGDDTALEVGGAPTPHFGALLEDVVIPPYFERAAVEVVGCWLSGKGVRSWLHYDSNGLHNLNAQVRGEKVVWLYSPADAARLYPFLFTGEMARFSQYSRVDVEAPDLARFPAFEGATCHAGILEEGDVLFIPAFWFHSFEHRGLLNANVNFWWRPARRLLHAVSARARLFGALSRALPAGAPTGLSPETRALLREVELSLLDPAGIMIGPQE